MSLFWVGVGTAVLSVATTAYVQTEQVKQAKKATARKEEVAREQIEKEEKAIAAQKAKEELVRKQTIMRMQKRRAAAGGKSGRSDVKTSSIGEPTAGGKRLLGE